MTDNTNSLHLTDSTLGDNDHASMVNLSSILKQNSSPIVAQGNVMEIVNELQESDESRSDGSISNNRKFSMKK